MLRLTRFALGSWLLMTGAALSDGIPSRSYEPGYGHCGRAPFAGFYAGGNVGVGSNWSSHEVANTFTSPQDPAFTSISQFSSSSTDRSFVGGGQVGYNWQCDALVWGIEADWSKASFDQSTQYAVPGGTFFPPGSFFPETVSHSVDWFGTIRGRIGLAYHNVMGYFTAGLAYGGVKSSAAISFTPPAGAGFSGGGFNEKDTQWGWTVGGGIETVIGSNWTLRAEALYVNLGDTDHNITFFPLNGNPACCAQTISARFDDSFAVARVGLNYKFGGWK
jgi:outer membrane immunogenic protein